MVHLFKQHQGNRTFTVKLCNCFHGQPRASSGPDLKLLFELWRKYDDLACINERAKIISIVKYQISVGPLKKLSKLHERNDSQSASYEDELWATVV